MLMANPPSIRVVGFDPSLRNWGVAQGTLTANNDGLVLTIDNVSVIQPVLPTSKQVRKNSLDLETAFQLSKGAMEAAKGAQAIFVEVPVGSKSARAMASYGVVVGVLGALRAMGIPFFEVTATESKLVSVGSKTATKKEMIAWATQKHPEANWPTEKQKGVLRIIEGKAEHEADAIAAIYAGIHGNLFKQMTTLTNMGRAA